MNLKSSSINHSTQPDQTLVIPAVLRSRSSSAFNVPVTAGLCAPKGRLSDAVSGAISGFSKSVPVQLDVLNRWNDGSVRWMLASFVAPEVQATEHQLNITASNRMNPRVEASRNLNQSAAAVTTVKLVNGEICLSSRDLTCDPPVEQTLRFMPGFHDMHGEEQTLQFDGIREEVCGQERQVFVISARLRSLPFVTLQFRLTQWASAGLLQVETRIRNTRRARHQGGLWDLGDAGSIFFRSLEVSIRSDEISANAKTHWRAERDQPFRSTMSEVFVRQFGSGGEFWSSPNHITADGRSSALARGYEGRSESGTLHGHRAEPELILEGDSSFIALAVPEFWQQFPGSVAAAMGSLEVGLFPALPEATYELQGGEQKTQSFWLRTGTGTPTANSLNWVYDQPRLRQSAGSLVEANVLPWFPDQSATNANADVSQRFQKYLTSATTGRFSLDSRRASIDEYGWRNFGDVPADHEQTHYAGSNTIVSHYNNQFDMIYGGMLQWLSSGDLKWFDLFAPLARHVIDIDLYHTSADRAAFNGGLFWHTDHYVDARSSTHRTYSRHNQKPGQPYGGGPSCEHNYTTGLLHYHFLTGCPEARESVLTLADWVIQMDDGRETIFALLDNGPTGAASATVFEDFHGPGRGAGNSINALLDAWLLTGSDRYLSKLDELIKRCVHPLQNPHDLHLLDAEGHWSYTVFLNALGRYLLAKRDAEMFDAMYSYARDVMKTYGRWMAAHECRTLDHPEQLQYPTEAWAAQDFRKANVLRIAATCEDETEQAAMMRAKADCIQDAAWDDFAKFGDAAFTARCLSIAMTEGQREVYHRTCPPVPVPSSTAVYESSSWSMFVPQKQRVKSLLKSPVGLLKASIAACHPQRIRQTWNAIRRQM